MSNDPAGPDDLTGQSPQPANQAPDTPTSQGGDAPARPGALAGAGGPGSRRSTRRLLCWLAGLVAVPGAERDRSAERVGRMVCGALAMGWRGSALHWHRYETA